MMVCAKCFIIDMKACPFFGGFLVVLVFLDALDVLGFLDSYGSKDRQVGFFVIMVQNY